MKIIIKVVHGAAAPNQDALVSHLAAGGGGSVRLTQYTLIHQEGSHWLE